MTWIYFIWLYCRSLCSSSRVYDLWFTLLGCTAGPCAHHPLFMTCNLLYLAVLQALVLIIPCLWLVIYFIWLYCRSLCSQAWRKLTGGVSSSPSLLRTEQRCVVSAYWTGLLRSWSIRLQKFWACPWTHALQANGTSQSILWSCHLWWGGNQQVWALAWSLS